MENGVKDINENVCANEESCEGEGLLDQVSGSGDPKDFPDPIRAWHCLIQPFS